MVSVDYAPQFRSDDLRLFCPVLPGGPSCLLYFLITVSLHSVSTVFNQDFPDCWTLEFQTLSPNDGCVRTEWLHIWRYILQWVDVT